MFVLDRLSGQIVSDCGDLQVEESSEIWRETDCDEQEWAVSEADWNCFDENEELEEDCESASDGREESVDEEQGEDVGSNPETFQDVSQGGRIEDQPNDTDTERNENEKIIHFVLDVSGPILGSIVFVMFNFYRSVWKENLFELLLLKISSAWLTKNIPLLSLK